MKRNQLISQRIQKLAIRLQAKEDSKDEASNLVFRLLSFIGAYENTRNNNKIVAMRRTLLSAIPKLINSPIMKSHDALTKELFRFMNKALLPEINMSKKLNKMMHSLGDVAAETFGEDFTKRLTKSFELRMSKK